MFKVVDELLCSSFSDEDDENKSPTASGGSPGVEGGVKSVSPPKGSPRSVGLLDRLCSEGHSMGDITSLVALFEQIPGSFRGKLLLKSRELVMPLDVGVEWLRRDLQDSGDTEPMQAPLTTPTAPRQEPDPVGPSTSGPPVAGSALQEPDPVGLSTSGPPVAGPSQPVESPPAVPLVQVTVSETAGRVLSIIQPQAANKRPGADLANEPPKASKSEVVCALCNTSVGAHLQRHLVAAHLPWFYGHACYACKTSHLTWQSLQKHMARTHNDEPRDPDADHLVWVRSMIDILGAVGNAHGFVNPGMLVSYCKNRGISATKGAHFQHSMAAKFIDLAVAIREPPKTQIQVSPPNHPVSALHWEILYGLMRVNPMLEGKLKNLTFGTDRPPDFFSAQDMWLAIGDSHCHLGSAASKAGLSVDEAVRRWSAGAVDTRMSFVVDNRVLGGDWDGPFPTSVELQGGHHLRVYYTFGVHPRLVAHPPGSFARLHELAENDHCVAIGEFGLDMTTPQDTWATQVRTFRRHATLGCTLKKTLVLHLRGSADEPLSAVLDEAYKLLGECGVPHRHPILIHCYTGSLDQSLEWLKGYPNTMFGVSSKTLLPGPGADFARAVAVDRFVLESDSPFLGPGPKPTNPWCLPSLAVSFGRLRNLPTRVVLRLSTTNARTILGLAGDT